MPKKLGDQSQSPYYEVMYCSCIIVFYDLFYCSTLFYTDFQINVHNDNKR